MSLPEIASVAIKMMTFTVEFNEVSMGMVECSIGAAPL